MLKIALCQINTTIGAFEQNAGRALEFLKQAASENTEIAVFPELTLSSYPPLDLLDRSSLALTQEQALTDFTKKAADIEQSPRFIVLGAITRNPAASGRALQNSVLVLEKSPKTKEYKIIHSQAKRLLPTYDVFDESRYFEPGQAPGLWNAPFGKVALSVCEDAWFDDPHGGRRIYREDPALALKGADFAINVSASPFEYNKITRRRQMISGFAGRIGAPMVYVNQVGANDEILFDGGSFVTGINGAISYEMPTFREGIAVVTLDPKSQYSLVEHKAYALTGEGSALNWEKMFLVSEAAGRVAPTTTESAEIESIHRGLVVGIRDYFRKTGFKKAVLGLSGGIDSAVVASLAAEALGPRNVIGIAMPSQYSSSHSLADAEELAKKVGIEFRVHSLKFIFTAFLMELKPSFGGLAADATEENIQARLRGVMLMALANKRCGLLLTTGNKSELGVGFCTTYGDMAGALAPIGDLYKTKVYKLAEWINGLYGWIPKSTLTKPPSAELRPNQTDQDTLPPYDVLDRILEMHFERSLDDAEIIAAGENAELVRKILHLVRTSEFKRRQAAPVLKITSKAFGLGRRIPVAKYY